MSSAFGNYTFFADAWSPEQSYFHDQPLGRSSAGASEMIPRHTLSRPLRGKSCLNSGGQWEIRSLRVFLPTATWPHHSLVTHVSFYCILLNLISVFTIQSFYIFQLKKKNLQTEKFGKNSQWNASHLTWCCPQPSVSYLSIEGKLPAVTRNHLEVETFGTLLPKRHLLPKPTFSAIDIVTIWGILCQLDID